MVGLIVFFVVMTVVAVVGVKVGRLVAGKISGYEVIGKRFSAARLTSIAAPAAAFLIFCGAVSVIAPPQSEFTTTNVSWDSQDTGILGDIGNAVLVRVPGASVEPGVLYSTATLRGEQWVSVPGGSWVNGGLGMVVLAYGVTLIVVGGFTAAVLVVMTHGKSWLNTAKVAYSAAATAVTAKPAADATPAPAPAPEPVAETAAPAAA